MTGVEALERLREQDHENRVNARWLLINNLLAARGLLSDAKHVLPIAKPGGGEISDLGAMERDLKEMLSMVEEMLEARER